MMKSARSIGPWVCLVSLLLATSCGYLQAGSWEGDPKNWHRIFGEQKPAEVTLIHSFYERLSGWKMRYRFYLAFEAPEQERIRLVKRLKLSALSLTPAPGEIVDRDAGSPAWFLPGELTDYMVWIGSPEQHLRLSVNSKTGVIYLSDRRP
jgi:hypothetical protein